MPQGGPRSPSCHHLSLLLGWFLSSHRHLSNHPSVRPSQSCQGPGIAMQLRRGGVVLRDVLLEEKTGRCFLLPQQGKRSGNVKYLFGIPCTAYRNQKFSLGLLPKQHLFWLGWMTSNSSMQNLQITDCDRQCLAKSSLVITLRGSIFWR